MKFRLVLALLLLSISLLAQTCPLASVPLGLNTNLGGAVPYGVTSHPFNVNVSGAGWYPITTSGDDQAARIHVMDPASNNCYGSGGYDGSCLYPNPEFGQGSPVNGQPYLIVDNSTPLVPVYIPADQYHYESDAINDVTHGFCNPGPNGNGLQSCTAAVPIPAGRTDFCSGSGCTVNDSSDRIAVLVNRDNCYAFEMYKGYYDSVAGKWYASNVAIWDMMNYVPRPYGMTGIGASGTPIFPLLIKYDETHNNAINHTLRCEMSNSRNAAILPAEHRTSGAGPGWPEQGLRWRLKSSYDTSWMSNPDAKAVVQALKTYGCIMTDNSGGGFYVDGSNDSRWNGYPMWLELQSIRFINQSTGVPNFEFVTDQSNGIPVSYGPQGTNANWPSGTAPTVQTFTATPSSISSGQSSTLHWTTTNAGYVFVDPAVGPIRTASASVSPTSTTTYTVVAANQYGADSKTVTVNVSGGSSIASATFTNSGTESCGTQATTYWDSMFPGYAGFRLGQGGVYCGQAGAGYQNLYKFWDLKNDANQQYPLQTDDTGMFQHQGTMLTEPGDSTRYSEWKESAGLTSEGYSTTVNAQNNVRSSITLHGPMRAYGAARPDYPPDPYVWMDRKYVFYRHGTGTGVGAGKVYLTETLGYNTGESGKTGIKITGESWYLDVGWYNLTGEQQTNSRSGCYTTGFSTFGPSPFNLVYENPGNYSGKQWLLFSANVANSSPNSSEQLPGQPGCWNPDGPSDGQSGRLQPGHLYQCGPGATSTACAAYPTPDLGKLVYSNLLEVSYDVPSCGYMTTLVASYFLGGLRFYCNYGGGYTINAGSSHIERNAGFFGDNGITTPAVANAFAAEYIGSPVNSVPAPAVSNASFDPEEGYWTISTANANSGFSNTATGSVLHSPAFHVTGYTNSAPNTITVGGINKAEDTDFVAVKEGSDLVLQYLADVADHVSIVIPSGGGSDSTPPTVSITQPSAGSVSGTITVAASATDDTAMQSVQFKLDGSNLGTQQSCSGASCTPSISWNTTQAANGVHALTAYACDTDSPQNCTTSAAVTITVSNGVAPVGSTHVGTMSGGRVN